MKGIIKYNTRFYKKSDKPLKEGDLVKLECKRGSDYFKYNGIYTVNKWNEILVPLKEENGKKYNLCIKLGYNVFKHEEYSKLVEVQRRKSLPKPVKEEQMCGYTI
ncbi:MAG: hypothetical protein WC333_01775 [Dehalococcoidia bacterium]|jgi:hypothetical protein